MLYSVKFTYQAKNTQKSTFVQSLSDCALFCWEFLVELNAAIFMRYKIKFSLHHQSLVYSIYFNVEIDRGSLDENLQGFAMSTGYLNALI